MAENEPVVVIIDGKSVSYYAHRKNARVLDSNKQAATILHLATPQEEEEPSGKYLGQRFLKAGVTPEQAIQLKSYLSSAAIKLRKHPEVSEQIQEATIVLSSAIGFMNTQDLPERVDPPLDKSITGKSGVLHLPDASKKQSE